jgi:hypothetical protein
VHLAQLARLARLARLATVIGTLTAALPSHATDVIWADWQSSTSTTVTGTLATPTPIGITFSSPSGFGFVQTGFGTNYWTEPNPASRPSWNSNAAQFDQPFQVISTGQGYWGNGTITLGPNNSFVGSGEPHGILYFPGTFSSLTFTSANEYWHGVTVGVAGLVPEASTYAMFGIGLGLGLVAIVGARRRRPD